VVNTGLNLIPWSKISRWKCIRCGKCCSLLDVQLGFEDEKRLRKYGDVFSYGRIGVYLKKVNGKCIFYEAGKCLIYPDRPLGCRNYPFYIRRNGVEDAKFRFKNQIFFVYLDSSCRGIEKGKGIKGEIKKVLSEMVSKANFTPETQQFPLSYFPSRRLAQRVFYRR
jgi:hypothetical protein